MSFGDRLKMCRESAGLTQQKLAMSCDVEDAMIRSYEKNRRFPGKRTMIRLINVLKASPDYLFQDELEFNPYEEKDILFSDISRLSPKSYVLIKDFVESLKRQDSM